MAKKARQRISYVLELDHSSSGGHRLGVNGLAVDADNAILYSGGRDGIVCAWDLETPGAGASKPKTKFLSSTQAHTHWINDIVLASNKTALVSASSDLTVKVWRPLSSEEPAHTIGQHSDYVKCLATTNGVNWVASGGLDRKIKLWDLTGAGETLEIDTQGEEIQEKGSVYALSAGRNIIANGGPESSVRLWDPRAGGKSVTKFVGHTDMVRSILVNESCDTIMTASSDQTIKVWSVTAGRCMYTLTMHNDSVWSLSSDHPELSVFYSSDRSGLVVKTDVRGTSEMDEGLSVALAQEHDGVSKIVTTNDYVWTASASSSINRWANVDTGPEALIPDDYKSARASILSSMPEQGKQIRANGEKSKIPANSILRISHTATFPPQILNSSESNLAAPSSDNITERVGELVNPIVVNATEPIYHLPEETIEGQNGLVKHRLLNDRRRVLTLDTAGDVLLWDLIQCQVIRRFGKKHMEDVEPEVNTTEAVAPWCSIDTSSGNLAVVLEPFNCFDAEMYADELVTDEPIEFRDDQRINLGKWVLRYLFAKLIDEEIIRDEIHRNQLNEGVRNRQAAARANPPISILIPNSPRWEQNESAVVTPKGNDNYPMTPGMTIAVATPAPGSHLPGVPENAAAPTSPQEKKSSQIARASGDDYFSNGITSAETPAKAPVTPAAAEKEPETPKSPTEAKDNGKGTFGKKFRMGMSFGSKKLGRSASTNIEKPIVIEEKKDDENKSESSSNHEKEVDDSFFGVLQRLRNEYEKQLHETPDKIVETKITPSLPTDTPVLKLPAGTRVIIQEETSGGSADLYRGTVETVGADADMIEQKAPKWLGEVLLTNTIPAKEPVKVSFILHPWQDTLPSIATTDGNNRLNANRMLRVKKILSYVAERIDPSLEEADENALKPEEYLELYCNEQLLPIDMSLATLRAHIWKGGSDVVLYYKANGRKELPKELPIPAEQPQAQAQSQSLLPQGTLPPENEAESAPSV